jgi:ATP-dependent Lon protease
MDALEEEIPILPLRNVVLFPGVAIPVEIARKKSLRLIKACVKASKVIGVVCQKDSNVDDPSETDLYQVGVLAEVVRVLEMPNGSYTAIVQGKCRFKIDEMTQSEPYMKAKYHILDDPKYDVNDKEFNAMASNIRDLTIKLISTGIEAPRELLFSIKNHKNLAYLVNFAACNIPPSTAEKQELLETDSIYDRAYKLLFTLNKEFQLLQLKESIQMKTHEGINQQQKEYFLQQQMKQIQEELGGPSSDSDVAQFREKAKGKKWSEAVGEVFEKEVRKLERIPMSAPDYSVQMQYLNSFINLPWNEYSKDNFNLANAQKVLDKDHFGLEKVKERIIEHLAVLKLKGEMKSPILCLYGPPGVGKTSLGKSIATALKRKYVRMSLGGLHDEAEIRGHRRTYIGAMPGRIIQNLIKAGTSNPVFVLDEIDKISGDYKGDPSAALLEVLDPEQNNTFHDNYLDVDYDLSKVMFIATANSLSSISQPLLDRMELIDVSGYIMEEKVEIAARHLVPKQMEAHGIAKGSIKIPKKTLQAIIEGYTLESGVRQLDKQIAKIMRKVAKKIAMNETFDATIDVAALKDYLGPVIVSHDKYQGNSYAGVVTGLAWTSVGGEILFIESCLSRGTNSKLTLTGNLGDVMKESAILALEYIHSHASTYGIPEEMFTKWNVHIHVPEGATPKDGPSAGIALVTSLMSTFTQRKVRSNLAMTGEITLRGKVLPVGGIKEKILAAKRAGLKDIILCKDNRKDIEEIKAEYLKGLTFHYVDDIKEVIDFAILDEKVENPLF